MKDKKKYAKYRDGAILALRFLFKVDKLPTGTESYIWNYYSDRNDPDNEFGDFLGMHFDIPHYFTITGIQDCFDALVVSYSESDPLMYTNLKLPIKL